MFEEVVGQLQYSANSFEANVSDQFGVDFVMVYISH